MRPTSVSAALLSALLISACGGDAQAPAGGGSGGPVGSLDAGGGGGGGTPDAGGGGGTPDAGGGGGPTHFAVGVVRSGSGQVMSNPEGIKCGSTCAAGFNSGVSVSLLATPGAGFTFAGWGGACSGSGLCTVSADATVYATFQELPPPPPPQKQIAVSLAGSAGSVSSSPAGIVCPGSCTASFAVTETVTLTATPGANSTFSGWSGACSGAGSCMVSGLSSAAVTATFAPAGPPAECAGLAPDAEPRQQYVHPPFDGKCGIGMGNAAGTLAFSLQYDSAAMGDYSSHLVFVSNTGAFLQDQSTFESLSPAQERNGVVALGGPGHSPHAVPPGFKLFDFGPTGDLLDSSSTFRSQNIASAPGLFDDLVVAGDFAVSDTGPFEHAVRTYGTHPALSSHADQSLASPGAVFGVGLNQEQMVLVITDGGPTFGSGHISAQWFAFDGTPVTGEFVLLSKFVAGPSTWFETAPLLSGGFAVRRRDTSYPGGKLDVHSQWLVVLANGSTAPQPAPGWLASRPDTRLQVARGGHAYAVLPDRELSVPCTQRVETLAADGTACGARDYPLGEGSCDTFDLTLGADGTVIQPFPSSFETETPIGTRTCSWFYWASALH